jgi:hypothetical protein
MTGHVADRLLGPLPSGTEVGPWRLVSHSGGGANGIVYLAEPVEPGQQGPFALKLATLAGDERFEREAALLSRIHHPNVPRLRDSGVWIFPNGAPLPYLVMDWVAGVSLYDWADQQPRTSRQMLRMLAQLARVLEAVHQAGCVHRDVKGDNILVSLEGRAFLMDFGAGKFEGARPLTQGLMPPGTLHYRSPQAQRFLWAYHLERGISYEHTEADDVYALGVTAYRAVTGLYPPPGFDMARAFDPAFPPQPPLRPPRKLATVCRELDALILRMLANAPEERGRAGDVAQALEQAADRSGSSADAPIIRRPRKVAPYRRRRPALVPAVLGLAAAVGGVVFVLSDGWPGHPREELLAADTNGCTVALGDSAPRIPVVAGAKPTSSNELTLEMPKEPFTGQQLPPCDQGFEVEIELIPGKKNTRSCWFKIEATAEACKKKGYEYRGGCYVPSYPSPKVPRSIGP